MGDKPTKSGSDRFIVDNSDKDWKVLRYLHDWCQLPQAETAAELDALLPSILDRAFKGEL